MARVSHSDSCTEQLMASIEQYLQSPLQLEHAFQTLLESELFEFHSERMCEIIVDDAQSVSSVVSFLLSLLDMFPNPESLSRIQTRIRSSYLTASSFGTANANPIFSSPISAGSRSSHCSWTMF